MSVRTLTVLIPAFNEAAAIGETLGAVVARIPPSLDACEVLVVDDGSSDGTADVVASFSRRDPRVRCVVHAENRGKGSAVRTGIAEARMDWILLLDADHQIRFDEIERVLRDGPAGGALVGWRRGRRGSAVRWMVTLVFKAVVRTALGVRARDVNCPFKLFRREVAGALPLRCEGFLIDAEILLRLRQGRVSCEEIGVAWHPRTHGRSTVSLRHVPQVARELGSLVWERVTVAGRSPR